MEYENQFEYCQAYDNSSMLDVELSVDNSKVSQLIEALLASYPISPNAKSKTQDQVVEYLFMIIANIAKAYLHGECVAIPRSSSFLNGETVFSSRKLSKSTFITVLNFLRDNRLIAEHRGHFDHENNSGKVSRYWATKTLYEHFATVRTSDFCIVRDIPSVILHDSTGKTVPFSENKISQFFSGQIFYINSFYTCNKFRYINGISYSKLINPYCKYNKSYQHNIYNSSILGRNEEEGRTEILYPKISAVFSRNDFNCGGRLYSIPQRGTGWQGMTQRERKTITINNEPTVELDFKGLHISMLYAIMNIQLNEDPYACFTEDLRPLYKTLMLRLLNARSIGKTINSIEDSMRTLSWKYWVSEKEMKLLNTVDQFKPDWRLLVDELIHRHKTIRRFFGSDCGIYLQRLDAEMMLNILSVLTTEGIPALPVHDSIIVPKHAQGRATEVMKGMYRRYMGFSCDIKVG